ncbi:hypothetical protein [Clostridium cellulovorans]|uniref:Uncharacterized protein n=1 Tax=Clostridium cellulovorans (strain ATCC 35296 / DSM 3052 / OCM 3 / 743B) TaxID=573061 RepID=D9SP86_CLOC7|nr:hypothetical protein [Clostridium cellulovorans]ADL52051.1 hypothetical protein Clocel_2332 [Clostridium cellulovorans 743B]
MVNSIKNDYSKSIYQTQKNTEIRKLFVGEKKPKLSVEEESKISAEEDAILYEKLKSYGYTKEMFDNLIKTGYTFPPHNAPGSVRRAWRQIWDSASPEMKDKMRSFTSMFYGFERDYPNYMSNIQNDIKGYFNLIEDLYSHIQQYNADGDLQAQKQYRWYNEVLELFTTELEKFT